MKRRSPSPGLKSAVAALLQTACGKPRFFLITPRQPAENPSVLESLELLDPKHVASIASDMTSIVDLALSGRYQTLTSTDRSRELVARAAAIAPAAPLLLSLASSGFVREAAVMALPPPGGPFGLALLLLRANDWVRQVREAAAAKIHQFLDDATIDNRRKVEIIAGCFELTFDPERFGRADEVSGEAIARLREIPGVDAALHEVILASRTDIAPRLLRTCLRRAFLDERLSEFVRQGRHPRVRQIALQGLLSGCHRWKQDGQLQQRDIERPADLDHLATDGLRDPSIDVQRVALSYVIQTPDSPLHGEKTFRAFLLHRSPSLVEKAVFGLRRLGVDVVEESRDRLRSQNPAASCVGILRRFGEPEDGRLIYAARARSSEAVCDVFLAAAAQLSYVPAIDELRRIALEAEDLADARQASRALLRAKAEIDFDALKSVLLSGGGFVERKLDAFAERLSVVQMAHLTVLMSQRRIDYDCDHLWRSIARRRNRGAFRPAEDEVAALLATVQGDRELEMKIHGLLGLGRPASNVTQLR